MYIFNKLLQIYWFVLYLLSTHMPNHLYFHQIVIYTFYTVLFFFNNSTDILYNQTYIRHLHHTNSILISKETQNHTNQRGMSVYLAEGRCTAWLPCEALPWWWGESRLDNTGDLDVVLTGTFCDKDSDQLTHKHSVQECAWKEQRIHKIHKTYCDLS